MIPSGFPQIVGVHAAIVHQCSPPRCANPVDTGNIGSLSIRQEPVKCSTSLMWINGASSMPTKWCTPSTDHGVMETGFPPNSLEAGVDRCLSTSLLVTFPEIVTIPPLDDRNTHVGQSPPIVTNIVRCSLRSLVTVSESFGTALESDHRTTTRDGVTYPMETETSFPSAYPVGLVMWVSSVPHPCPLIVLL